MLVFAAIVPPTPLLLPHIGKEHTHTLTMAREAVDVLKSSLAASHADVCVLVSQHGALPARFGIGINELFRGSLQSFGDLREYTCAGAPASGHQLLVSLPHGMAGAVTQPPLDHGSVTACQLLFPEQSVPLVPLYPSSLPYETHVRFGAAVAEPLMQSRTRIALIAIGDLSHHVTEASPEGYRPEGVLFDQAAIKAMKKHSVKHLLDTAHKYEGEAQTSGMRAFLILLGILEDFHARFNLLSYEAPSGIGYLTAEYIM